MYTDYLLPWQLLVRECFICGAGAVFVAFIVCGVFSKRLKKNKAIEKLSHGLFWAFLCVLTAWVSLEFFFLVSSAMSYIFGILAAVVVVSSIVAFFAFIVTAIESKNDWSNISWGIVFAVSIFAVLFLYSKSSDIIGGNGSYFLQGSPFL
ncbi:MAG: hypothetical protein HKM07_01755 [Chlamydiae bacterium]|nr:hypothetical protein [Chlamydiota bacterium]